MSESTLLLKYPGSKARTAEWIISHFPDHDGYLEPFLGSASVLMAKRPVKSEIANDLDHRVVNFFRVCRDHPDDLASVLALTPYSHAEFDESEDDTDDPIDQARRFAVRCHQALATRTGKGPSDAGWGRVFEGRSVKINRWNTLPDRIIEVARRLANVQFECRDAIDVIEAAARHPEFLIYADPPYTSGSRRHEMYRHEMDDADQRRLADALHRHPGAVVLSGYDNELYDSLYTTWHKRYLRGQFAQTGGNRTEVLWLNDRAASAGQQAMF